MQESQRSSRRDKVSKGSDFDSDFNSRQQSDRIDEQLSTKYYGFTKAKEARQRDSLPQAKSVQKEGVNGIESTFLDDLDFNYTGTGKSNNLTKMTKSIPKGVSMKKGLSAKDSDQSNSQHILKNQSYKSKGNSSINDRASINGNTFNRAHNQNSQDSLAYSGNPYDKTKMHSGQYTAKDSLVYTGNPYDKSMK